jgi:hypothetical protein
MVRFKLSRYAFLNKLFGAEDEEAKKALAEAAKKRKCIG